MEKVFKRILGVTTIVLFMFSFSFSLLYFFKGESINNATIIAVFITIGIIFFVGIVLLLGTFVAWCFK